MSDTAGADGGAEDGSEDRAPGSARWRGAQVQSLLRFAEASRDPAGGFWWLDDVGRPARDRPTFTWIAARMTHVFALAQRLGHQGADELVAHGVRSLLGPLRDTEHGGWFASVGGPDADLGTRQAYDHAFVLLAGSSALAVAAPGAQELFDRAAQVVDERFWDEDAGMGVETWDPSWHTLDAYRGANSNMHLTEALLAASSATGDPTFARRALRITTRMIDSASAHGWRLPEHYDESWRPLLDYNRDKPADPFRPFGSTVGHGMEWARLILQLRSVTGVVPAQDVDRLADAAVHLFDRAHRDGWAVDGAPGYVYTVDWQGAPVVRDRMHWVLTEAVAAAAVLESVTGWVEYATRQRELWSYAAEHLVDEVGGSWWHQLDPAGAPSATVWAGKPDVYHAIQALLLPGTPVTASVMESVSARG